jgi:hypothetical protein
VYALTEVEQVVDVLAVRKRPPYDYGDLSALLGDYPPEWGLIGNEARRNAGASE